MPELDIVEPDELGNIDHRRDRVTPKPQDPRRPRRRKPKIVPLQLHIPP